MQQMCVSVVGMRMLYQLYNMHLINIILNKLCNLPYSIIYTLYCRCNFCLLRGCQLKQFSMKNKKKIIDNNMT